MKKIVFLYIDGCKYNYLGKMPFLKKLSKKGSSIPLEVEPLHQFEFSIFCSQYQENHNKWCWFYFNPDESPFKWVKPFNKFFSLIDFDITRDFITYFSSLVMYLKGETRFVRAGKIPLNKINLFSPTAKKSFIDKNSSDVPTLFDILRENNFSYFLCEWPLVSYGEKAKLKFVKKDDKSNLNLIKKNLDKDFLFVHLTDLDFLMHKYGTESREVIGYLSKLDNLIEKFYNSVYEKFKDFTFIVCSDHGMVDIKGKIDIFYFLKNIDFSYEIFLDSTSVRFWFKDKSKIDLVKSKLSKIRNGKVFDKNSFNKIPLKYNFPYTSDLMFIANPGYQILPNYFDGYNLNKAMHGYLPCKEEEAIFLVDNYKLNKKRARIIDICPSVLEILNLNIPKDWEGKSFIKKN